MSQNEPSGWAIGWALFSAVMLITVGCFQAIAGIAGIAEDDVYAKTPNYVLELDVTTWGWAHLVLGALLILSGLGIMTGNVVARTVGVLVAAVSMVANFGFIPIYPVWSIAIIAVDIAVIWALTAHGRDVVAE
ncbi:MAG: hypothetical protein ACJ739_03105 [Acidimicrobiales bacterium]